MRMLAVAKCRTDGYPAVGIQPDWLAPVGLFLNLPASGRPLNIELHRLLREVIEKLPTAARPWVMVRFAEIHATFPRITDAARKLYEPAF